MKNKLNTFVNVFQPHLVHESARVQRVFGKLHTSIQYEYTTKDEYECNTSAL